MMNGIYYCTRRSIGWLAIAALLVAILLTASGPKQATAGQEEYQGPAPKELLKDFISLAKKTQEYQLYNAMRPEKIRPIVDEWEKELGLEIRLHTWSFTEVLSFGGGLNVKLSEGKYASLRYIMEKKFGKHMYNLLELTGEVRRYGVSGKDLHELDFECVNYVEVLAPANTRVESFSAHNETFLAVIQRLCSVGKLDYSVRSDLASNIRLDLELRNRTLADSLDFAARAAGWKVSYCFSGGYTKRRPPNTHVDLEHVDWGFTAQTSAWPIDQLRKEIFRAAKLIPKNRPVAVLEPETKSQEPAEKEPASS